MYNYKVKGINTFGYYESELETDLEFIKFLKHCAVEGVGETNKNASFGYLLEKHGLEVDFDPKAEFAILRTEEFNCFIEKIK